MDSGRNDTERVVRFVAETSIKNVPNGVLAGAKTAILDCLGVALAGSAEEAARICAEQVRMEEARGAASVWGHGFKASATLAALANGTAAHALDFDHGVYLGQPTSGVIPAVMALAESLGASGRDLLEAYVAGFEATAKIAKAIPEEGRGGWHGAETLGTLGATLSCAKLLKLDIDKVRMALGIATSMASGVVRGMDSPVLFFYYHAKLGPEFIKKLYGEMEVSIARDYRQPIDWLAAGKFSLCIPCVSDEMDKAMDQGLPLGQIFNLKEGGTLSSSGGTLSLLQNAPHPNAAKVFVNWLLSREGQLQVQKGRKGRPRTGSNSLRTDIPKNDLPEEIQRKDGVDYFDADDDNNADRRPADKLFDQILGKANK